MEQIRRTLSPSHAPSGHPAKRQRRTRDHPEHYGNASGGVVVSYSQPTRSSSQHRANYPTTQSVQQPVMPAQLPHVQIPSIPPSLQPSTNPSPTHSRPASISMSVAHPQAYPAGPPEQPEQQVQWRRASSFSSPFNPYHPTPVASTTLHILMLLVHLGILIVLGILLSDLRRTTSTFHTMSNNGTGSYLRVGLYGGGLGSINRPFYIGGLGNGTVPSVTTSSAGNNTALPSQTDAAGW